MEDWKGKDGKPFVACSFHMGMASWRMLLPFKIQGPILSTDLTYFSFYLYFHPNLTTFGILANVRIKATVYIFSIQATMRLNCQSPLQFVYSSQFQNVEFALLHTKNNHCTHACACMHSVNMNAC